MERRTCKIMNLSFQNVIKWSKLCGQSRKKVGCEKLMKQKETEEVLTL